ncbi:MAG: Cof-type HAD-IIB family hydrolase [Lachnospiraceae bacterium]|nr:Cof-type HAD-IIB family hydrolase [Lachnospiraceae bacterium]
MDIKNTEMNKKALFFDIDGTILSEKTGQIPESAVRAIKAARENGHLTFINTGRTRACVPSKVQNVGFDGILCGCGTEIVYHGESVMHQGLSKEFCVQIAEAVQKAGVASILEGEVFYFAVPNRPAFQSLKNGGGLSEDGEMTLIFDWKPEDTFFDKFVFWTDEVSKEEIILDLIKDKMDLIVRGNGFFEVVPKGYTKAGAIRKVQEMFNITLENTYVFGDSSNDLSMFEYSPNAIAMKEHDPVLDPYTSYVTDTVENDGIEKAMKALKLIL